MIVPAFVSVAQAPDHLLRELWFIYRDSHQIGLDDFCSKTRQKFSDLVILREGKRILGFFGGGPVVPLQLPSGEEVVTRYLGQAMVVPELRRSGYSIIPPLLLGYQGVYRGGRRRTFVWQDCITVRTFLLAARHAPLTYPYPGRVMPDDVRFVRDAVGKRVYGAAYDPDAGVVRKASRLVVEPDIDPRRLSDPLIAFYAQANPGYVHGDGLIQVFPMSWSLLAHSSLTTLRRGPLRHLPWLGLSGSK